MGWCSGTYIFDAAIEAAYRLIDDVKSSSLSESDARIAIVKFAKVMRDELEDGDWDCQNESDFYQDLKYDLWPEWAKEDDEFEDE
jgi:hypothetical protein